MTLPEYTTVIDRTLPDLGTPQLNNLHMLLGMQTEVAEIADVFKRELAYTKSPDWVKVKEELGDVMFYLVNFCKLNNINLEDCLAKNVAKLQARYPDKFDAHLAINRDLLKERVILNS